MEIKGSSFIFSGGSMLAYTVELPEAEGAPKQVCWSFKTGGHQLSAEDIVHAASQEFLGIPLSKLNVYEGGSGMVMEPLE